MKLNCGKIQTLKFLIKPFKFCSASNYFQSSSQFPYCLFGMNVCVVCVCRGFVSEDDKIRCYHLNLLQSITTRRYTKDTKKKKKWICMFKAMPMGVLTFFDASLKGKDIVFFEMSLYGKRISIDRKTVYVWLLVLAASSSLSHPFIRCCLLKFHEL